LTTVSKFPAGAVIFPLRQNVQTGFGDHLTSYPTGTVGSFSGAKAAGSVKLTVQLLLVSRLRMCGNICTPSYIFIAWCSVKYRIRLYVVVLS